MKYVSAKQAIQDLLELRLLWRIGYRPMTAQEQYLATFACSSDNEPIGTAIVLDKLIFFDRCFKALRRKRSDQQILAWVGVRFYEYTAAAVAKRIGIPSRTAYTWVHSVDAAFENILDEYDMLARPAIKPRSDLGDS